MIERLSSVPQSVLLLASIIYAFSVITSIQSSQLFPDAIVVNEGDGDSPSLLELYDRLMSYFDEEAIRDFIDMKNRTDSDAAQLLLDIDNYLRDVDARYIVHRFWADGIFADAIFYMYNEGLVGIYTKINEVHQKYGFELVGPPKQDINYFPMPTKSVLERPHGNILNITKRAPELLQEFLDSLELERVRLYFHEVANATSLAKLYEQLSNEKFAQHYRLYKTLPALGLLGETLTGAGFEIDTFKKIVEVCMKWENHTSVGLRTP